MADPPSVPSDTVEVPVISAAEALGSSLGRAAFFQASLPPAEAVEPRPVSGPPQEAENVDGWGIAPNLGLALGEILMADWVVWMGHEYIRQGNISQVSPKTWWSNIEDGFGWDDNDFATNMWLHPVQGAVYHNAARANGFSYWESVPFAFLGSFHWECCGETHNMSINDWISTSVGGAALGEMLYRISSMILDNEAEGSERAWREAGALAVNPMRGVNRLVTGRAFEQGENPSDPRDWRGTHLRNMLSFGVRSVGEGERYSFDGASSALFVDLDLVYGDLFDPQRPGAFEFFTFKASLNFDDKKALGRLQGRGTLQTYGISDSETSSQVFSIAHYFDYIDNDAFEFGGQSIGFLWAGVWGKQSNKQFVASADIHGMILGGVNTEYAEFAEIPGERERDREYDFGSGMGSWLGISYQVNQFRVFDLSYRVNWMRTLNGTNVGGQNTDHIIQQASLTIGWPITDSWAISVRSDVFKRNSYFEEEDFDDVVQRVPELRIFGTWRAESRGGS